MLKKKAFLAMCFLSAIAGALYSCKDMGSELPRAVLTATTFSITLSPSGQATVSISGGNAPYSISRQPDPTLASATLTNNATGTAILVIQAVAANVSGTTNVKVVDSDTHGTSIDRPASENEIVHENEIEIAIRVTATQISFSTQVQPIFSNNCVSAGCHPGNGAPFSLQVGQSRDNLVNRDMLNGACGGKRVVAGNTDASGLVKKLEGNCGARMPLGGAALPSADITLIRDWISQGAQNN